MSGEQLKFEVYEEELLNPLRGHELTGLESFIASLLLTASSHRPIGNSEIVRCYESIHKKRLSERLVKDTIRSLRRDHNFPILARRTQPAGYWWCKDACEMEMFIESFRSQALDELRTLSRVVRSNYPALVGQLKLEID